MRHGSTPGGGREGGASGDGDGREECPPTPFLSLLDFFRSRCAPGVILYFYDAAEVSDPDLYRLRNLLLPERELRFYPVYRHRAYLAYLLHVLPAIAAAGGLNVVQRSFAEERARLQKEMHQLRIWTLVPDDGVAMIDSSVRRRLGSVPSKKRRSQMRWHGYQFDPQRQVHLRRMSGDFDAVWAKVHAERRAEEAVWVVAHRPPPSAETWKSEHARRGSLHWIDLPEQDGGPDRSLIQMVFVPSPDA
ncbi:hypothetical protein [Hydrogenibacillus schlegelii]|uniref:hypothetical protein n=1 Tax=Hydrogenibacillus schlegelii TaxID=1484 RepID=UPI00147143C1|nr:hypothetical protein [Hydrogenibacillus schlegelii]